MEKISSGLLARLEALERRVEDLERRLSGDDDLPVDFTAEVLGRPEPIEAEPETAYEEPAVEAVLEPSPGSMPEVVAEAEPVAAAAEPFPVPAPPVDRSRFSWRSGTPPLRVKNLRSAISLYERAAFIGTLFGEDYALYDQTVGDLNGMASLDDAEDYILARFPKWDLESSAVQAFMGAVRKKLG